MKSIEEASIAELHAELVRRLERLAPTDRTAIMDLLQLRPAFEQEGSRTLRVSITIEEAIVKALGRKKLSPEELVAAVQELRPGTQADSIRAGYHRMVKAKKLQRAGDGRYHA